MLMDHPSSSCSLISSPYLPHHFIWQKGNNKSLIHYPLTEAAMWKYLITGNKLNFNHLLLFFFFQGCTKKTKSKVQILHMPLIKYRLWEIFRISFSKKGTFFVCLFIYDKKASLLFLALASLLFNPVFLSAQNHTHRLPEPAAKEAERLIYLEPHSW